MKSFKNIGELYRLDWKRVYENKLTLLLIIALMVIPSLYAWFNIAALWDPYANTKDIKIAVYSEDKTAIVLDKEVTIGQTLLTNLKGNHTLDWQFVSTRKELENGVKSGAYYAGILLPSDFSTNLVSFVNGDIQKPHIEYQVNQKINAIAPKITDKGASTIQATISEEFIDTVSQTIFEALNDVGYDLDSHLVSLNKVTNKVLYLDSHLAEIDDYTKEVLELEQKLPEYKEKLAKAQQATIYFSEVDALGNKLKTAQKYLPEVEKIGTLLVSLEDKTGQIEQAGQQIKQVDEEFDEIVATLKQAIDTSKKGLVVIEQAQTMLPEISQFVNQANQTLPDISSSVEKLQAALPQIATSLSTSLDVLLVATEHVSSSLTDLNTFLGKLEDTAENKAVIKKALQAIDAQLTTQNQVLNTLITTLEKLQTTSGSTSLQTAIERLKALQHVGQTTQVAVHDLLTKIDSLRMEAIQQELTKIIKFSDQINQGLSQIDVAEVKDRVSQLLEKITALLATASDVTQTIVDKQLVIQLDELLTSTSGTIKSVIGFFDTYQKELPAIKTELHTANVVLNDNMSMIVGGIKTASSLYKSEYPVLREKINKTVDLYENDWPQIKNEVSKTFETINEKMPKIEKALALSSDFIKEDWPSLKQGLNKAAGFIKKGQEEVDLGEVIRLLKQDATTESDFLAQPVIIEQTDVYPIPNYGSASAPFYTGLCLWVGAVLFSSIATTEFHLSDKDKKRFSARQTFAARLLTFLTVGTAQALIVALGNLFLLRTYAAHPLFNVLFTLLIGIVFMTMVYVLVALFGNLGKGLAVIILVLSISGGGGNFPIQMSGEFFRRINPFLPFTYAVNLLRESVGGIYWPNTSQFIVILVGVGIVFVLVGFWLAPKVKAFFKKLNDTLKAGYLLH